MVYVHKNNMLLDGVYFFSSKAAIQEAVFVYGMQFAIYNTRKTTLQLGEMIQ